MRGHGRKPTRRGDIDYINQLADDIVDLIAFIRDRKPKSTVIVGGHSSGGDLAIRVGGGDSEVRADAFLLLAPFLQYDAPTVRPQSGGWAKPNLAKIIPLIFLNKLGITIFNASRVLEFNLPMSRRSGMETTSYTYRLMTGFGPHEYESDLRAMCEPTLVLVGSDDEAFYPNSFGPVFRNLAPQARVDLLPDIGHLDLATAPLAQEAVISLDAAFRLGGIPDYPPSCSQAVAASRS